MAHAHPHPHVLPSARTFALGVALNLAFVVVEGVAGLLSGSLALVADAGHNLTDVLGLALAWVASLLGRRRPTTRHTYGLRSTTILAALFNGLLLLVAVGAMCWEAVQRLSQPHPVASGTVLVVAAVGVAINLGSALLFWRGRHHDLNARGAFLHLAADAGISAGVVAAALLLRFTGWLWLDPLVSLAIGVLVVVSTWGLLQEALRLVLHGVPQGIDTEAVRGRLVEASGAHDVHDLHIWGMSTTEAALTAHLVLPEVRPSPDVLLARLHEQLHAEFGIGHVTLQLEQRTLARCCHLAGPGGACAPGPRPPV